MKVEEASNLKAGDIVFNIFQEELVIDSVHIDNDNKSYNVVCVNTGLFLESYHPNVLYKNLNDLTIAEYSFLLWINKNKLDILDAEDEILLIKKAYLDGYNQGFTDKPRCSGNKCKGQKN
jgi:hypothetical protein